MEFHNTPISGAVIVNLSRFSDKRGHFTRWFCEDKLHPILAGKKIVQANHSYTQLTGSIRGIHYQLPPSSEIKIIRCIRGKVFDVIVDLRQGSDTFLSWHGIELSAEGNQLLVIPEGCAHGFQVLEDDSELLYLHTEPYAPESESGVRYDDPKLAIKWPMTPKNLSDRDLNFPLIDSSYTSIKLTQATDEL